MRPAFQHHDARQKGHQRFTDPVLISSTPGLPCFAGSSLATGFGAGFAGASAVSLRISASLPSPFDAPAAPGLVLGLPSMMSGGGGSWLRSIGNSFGCTRE